MPKSVPRTNFAIPNKRYRFLKKRLEKLSRRSTPNRGFVRESVAKSLLAKFGAGKELGYWIEDTKEGPKIKKL